jgi:hypothetical protein
MSNILRLQPNPITDYLQENWQQILKEYLNFRKVKHGIENALVCDSKNESNKPMVTTVHEKKPVYEGNVHTLPLKVSSPMVSEADKRALPFWQKDPTRDVWRFDHIYELNPTLAKWVTEHDQFVAGCLFNLMQPGTVIRHHYGPEGNRNNIRIHLGFTTDPKIEFDIEGDVYSWKEGDLIAFDDSMVYHAVRHRGNLPRLICSIDYLRSELEPYLIGYTHRPFVPKTLRVPPQIDPTWFN